MHQVAEAGIEVASTSPRISRDDAVVEVAPDDRGDLQHVARRLVEAVDAAMITSSMVAGITTARAFSVSETWPSSYATAPSSMSERITSSMKNGLPSALRMISARVA